MLIIRLGSVFTNALMTLGPEEHLETTKLIHVCKDALLEAMEIHRQPTATVFKYAQQELMQTIYQ